MFILFPNHQPKGDDGLMDWMELELQNALFFDVVLRWPSSSPSLPLVAQLLFTLGCLLFCEAVGDEAAGLHPTAPQVVLGVEVEVSVGCEEASGRARVHPGPTNTPPVCNPSSLPHPSSCSSSPSSLHPRSQDHFLLENFIVLLKTCHHPSFTVS